MSLIEQFIERLHNQCEYADDYSASEFLTEQYNKDETICIGIIYYSFKKDSYIYAMDVINAVRASDINYFQKWFKDLLLEGKKIPKLKRGIEYLYDLYRDTFDSI